MMTNSRSALRAALVLLILSVVHTPLVHAQSDTTLVFTVDGTERSILIHRPDGPTDELPLVLNLHGSGTNPAFHQAATGMDAVADTAGFLVAYPEGEGGTWTEGDSLFLLQGMDLIESIFNTDPTRVYMTGFSAGAYAAIHAANHFSSRFAAIASVEGGLNSGLTYVEPEYGMPVLIIHNVHDSLVPYSEGEETRDSWIEWNGCSADADTVLIYLSPAVALYRYEGGRNNSEVHFYSVESDHGTNHYWPNQEEDGVEGSTVIWNFFRDYQREAQTAVGERWIDPSDRTFDLITTYPNPFNNSTRLRYRLNQTGMVTISLHNVLGRQVAQLVNETQRAGIHETGFQASNLSSGNYFVRLQSAGEVRLTRITYLE